MNSSFLADDFDELSKGECALSWPFSDADDQPLILQSFRPFRFDKDLGELVVVRHENAIMVSEILVRDSVSSLERKQFFLRCIQHHVVR